MLWIFSRRRVPKESPREQLPIFLIKIIEILFFINNLILKLGDFYKFNLSVSMFNYINNLTNQRDCILSCIFFNLSYHGYQTRTNSNLSVIRFNRIASQSSFVYQSPKNWNMLPMNLKKVSTANFKTKLKITFAFITKVFFYFFCFY